MRFLRGIVIVCLITILQSAPFASAGSSNSLMDVSRDGRRLIVANPDNGTVTVVDAEARKVLHEIRVERSRKESHGSEPDPWPQ